MLESQLTGTTTYFGITYVCWPNLVNQLKSWKEGSVSHPERALQFLSFALKGVVTDYWQECVIVRLHFIFY